MVQSSTELALDDDWLDHVEGSPDTRGNWFAGPARFLRRTSHFFGATPGQIVTMMVVLTLALVAAGAAMSQSMASRQRALDTVLTATEPMAHSAHLLYSSLSQADTVATTSFVQPGLLSQEQLALYMASIDRAAVTAAEIYEGAVAVDLDVTEDVTEILRDLPIYTALMERAKVNQRQGNPVGVAYMSEASTVMREQMLPAADRLSRRTQDEVAAEVVRLSSPQWVPLSGLFAALLFLLLAQWLLWRIFRRRLNRGFLAATAAIVVAIAWVGVSNFQSWHSGAVGFERAAQPWEELTSARLQAQESRTDETLALLSRQSVTRSVQTFDETVADVTEALDSFEALHGADPTVASARAALERWASQHETLVNQLADGEFEAATTTLNARPGTDAGYGQLDDDLRDLINTSRENTRVYINASLDATRLVSTAVAVLTLVAVACIWIGIRRRLGEYF